MVGFLKMLCRWLRTASFPTFERASQTEAERPSTPLRTGTVLYRQSHLDAPLRTCAKACACSLSNSRPTIIWLWSRETRGRDVEAIRALLQSYPDQAASCEALGLLLMSAHRYPDGRSQPGEGRPPEPEIGKGELRARPRAGTYRTEGPRSGGRPEGRAALGRR